jgi:hypothetical protein
MMATGSPSTGFFSQAWRWFKDQIVREVPPEDALCEFDCRKPQCTADQWASCERRLSHAAGELMPEQQGAPKPPSHS